MTAVWVRSRSLLVGSTAVGLAAHAACPVVVVRGREISAAESASLPVAVGVDGTSTSASAIAFGFAAAAERKVPLLAVHTSSDLLADPAVAPLLDWTAVERNERARLDKQLTTWSGNYPGRRAPYGGVLGPARPSAAAAVRAGAAGRGRVTGPRRAPSLFLGSVSHALIHKAACPVAIVRPH